MKYNLQVPLLRELPSMDEHLTGLRPLLSVVIIHPECKSPVSSLKKGKVELKAGILGEYWKVISRLTKLPGLEALRAQL